MPSVRSRNVVVDGEVRPATVRYDSGVVVSIGDGVADVDFGDLVVMPGLVDSHVHVNEPGRADWEGFESATRAAVAGGTTTIVDMPLNSIPPTVDPGALAEKRRAAAGKLSADTAFWGGLIPGSARHIAALAEGGVCGFKAFMVDSGVEEFPPLSLEEMEADMSRVAAVGLPVLIHAEDPAGLRVPGGAPDSYSSYHDSRPPESEASAVATAVAMAGRTGAQAHILHVSSGAAVDSLASVVTAETCPHYLVFDASEIPDGATEYKCAPPIRNRANQEALWDGLAAGALSMVVSDHSPAPRELKRVPSGDFTLAWGGIASVQLRLQAMWTAAVDRGVGLPQLVEWLSTAPARLAGLRGKGSIAVGHDADFVVFDPDGRLGVDGPSLEHRHPVTPYQGMTLRGSVVATMLRGNTVYGEGRVLPGLGAMLTRHG